MNRPRESLLTLFDPLFGSVSQRNGGDSSVELDDYDSEKENNMPLGDVSMTSFFSGSLKKARPQPALLKRRLVDVGDVTVDNTLLMNEVWEEMREDEESDDENSTAILGPVGKTPRASSSVNSVATPRLNPRTPFAELRMEREVTPVAHKRLLTRQKQLTNTPIACDSATQPQSSLSSLVDAVTSAGLSFAGSKPAFSETWPDVVPVSPRMPVVAITSSLQASPVNIPLPLSPIDISDLGAPIPRPRLPAPIRAHDRQSLDLQSSFQLQFDSAESSFDLLTDKISFLCSRSHDFDMTSGDEDMNTSMTSVLTPTVEDEVVNFAASIPLPSEDSPQTRSPYTVVRAQPLNITNSPLPVFTAKTYTPTQAMVSEDLLQSNDAHVVFSSARDPLMTLASSKSLHPGAPPPIQALRIVKRAKNAAAAAPPPNRRLSTRSSTHVEKKTFPPLQSDIPHLARISEPDHPAAAAPPKSASSSGPRRVPVADSKEVLHKAGGVGHILKNNRPKKVLLSDAVAQWGHLQPAKTADLDAVRDALKAIGTSKPKAPVREVKSIVRPAVSAHVGQKESRPASTIPRPVSGTSRLPAPVFGTNRAGAAAGRAGKPGVGLVRRVGTGL
ncbi:hypothetical protein EDD18DRAFT_1459333 [Armillaria luteobubalina]|uniref:Uncharacterized protein n=1 Tax=Armillaria luteobubalina TaxID=153913 RepID=A0AA39TU01_9AGAR|nr:hypothetical protein EDD18DRAFT_1459333 [Armillaria luteobubalina]